MFWILNALGKGYSTTIIVNVEYKNNPKNYVVLSELPNQLYVEVSSLGFDLLSYQLKLNKPPLTIDLERVKGLRRNGESFFSSVDFSVYNSFISKELGHNISVNSISPSKIDILLDVNAQKNVKISPIYNITFENQFQLDGNIIIKPAIVNISGPKSVVDTIQQVFTEEITLNNLSNTISKVVKFNKEHKKQHISFDMDEVIAHIPVEKFTESSILLPLEYINVPDTVELKAIPNEVELKFNLPLSKLSLLTTSKFNVFVDFNNVNNKYSKLRVNLSSYPKYLKNIKIKPSKVEYIIKRK